MEENRTEGEKRFIKERIVPRKNYKKVIAFVLTAVGLGVIFGLTAGITISLSQNLTEDKSDTKREQIIIVRDDTVAESGEQEETTAASKASESESETSPEESTEAETEEAPKGDLEILREAYALLEQSIVTVTVSNSRGTDWFDRTIVDRTEQFGVAVAEATGTVFILTEGSGLTANMPVTVEYLGKTADGVVRGVDERTHLGIISLSRYAFSERIPVAVLGNSFGVHALDRVYLAGQPMKVTGAVEAGMVTNVLSEIDVTDGYEQLFYTDMTRQEGGFAVMFNEEAEIVGWVSDYQNEGNAGVAAVCGISPLKYLIEDLCSGNSTAYLGVLCRSISRTEAAELGISAGLYVREVESGSPAYDCGIQVGDRLVSINDWSLSDSHALCNRMDDLEAGMTVSVKVGRRTGDGEEILELSVVLGTR